MLNISDINWVQVMPPIKKLIYLTEIVSVVHLDGKLVDVSGALEYDTKTSMLFLVEYKFSTVDANYYMISLDQPII